MSDPHKVHPLPASDASGEQADWRWSWPARLAFLFTGVLLPVVCLVLIRSSGPRWQSGQLADYVELLVSWKPSIAFYPFVLYNMTCMTLLVVAPARFLKRYVVRFGVYSGVLLSLQYWILACVTVAREEFVSVTVAWIVLYSLAVVFVPWGIGCFVHFLARRLNPALVWSIAVLTLCGIYVLFAMIMGGGEPLHRILGFAVVIGWFFCLASAAPWAVAAYAIMTFYVVRNRGGQRLQFSLRQLFGVTSWSAAYLAAWRTSIAIMLHEYAKLPTERPANDCYICTAAARGHRRLVGAEEHAAPSGGDRRVNNQMRCLKCAELVLAHLAPRSHCACRRIYNLVGPVLAAMLIHPLLADVAYLSLKPAEWTSRAGLALLLPGHGRLIQTIYEGRLGLHSHCRS